MKKKEKKNIWSYLDYLLIISLLIFLFSTGKFRLIQDRVNSFFGESQGIKIARISYTEINSEKMVNFSELQGKILLVNFWATWCPYCKREIKYLNKLQTEYREKGVKVIGISVDQEGKETVIDFLKKNKINYSLGMVNQEIIANFGEIISLPTTFIVNRQGVIQKKLSGFKFENSLRKEIEEQLKN